jgi:Uma2 family endonuclease
VTRDVGTPAMSLLEEIRVGSWSGEPGEMRVVPLGRPATVDDLWLTKLKAEIVDGQMIVIGPSGDRPARAAGRILVSLTEHEFRHGGGLAMGSRVAFVVDLPHRKSFCPDVSWYTGPSDTADFPMGAPVFAVEVRDPSEHGEEAERRMAAKRADYFAAGTRVVWDVDVLEDVCIRAYGADDPETPVVFCRGQTAHAEPAVPGWTFAVDALPR